MQRHRLDPVSLISGVLFLVLGGIFLFTDIDGGDVSVRWLWPLPVIALGLLLLAVGDRNDQHPEESEATTDINRP